MALWLAGHWRAAVSWLEPVECSASRRHSERRRISQYDDVTMAWCMECGCTDSTMSVQTVHEGVTVHMWRLLAQARSHAIACMPRSHVFAHSHQQWCSPDEQAEVIQVEVMQLAMGHVPTSSACYIHTACRCVVQSSNADTVLAAWCL